MINSDAVSELKVTENPRVVLVSILNGSKIPTPLKIMGFAYLNAASDIDIAKLKGMFLKVMEYVEIKDTDGLKLYLSTLGVNAEIIKMMLSYVANSDKNQ